MKFILLKRHPTHHLETVFADLTRVTALILKVIIFHPPLQFFLLLSPHWSFRKTETRRQLLFSFMGSSTPFSQVISFSVYPHLQLVHRVIVFTLMFSQSKERLCQETARSPAIRTWEEVNSTCLFNFCIWYSQRRKKTRWKGGGEVKEEKEKGERKSPRSYVRIHILSQSKYLLLNLLIFINISKWTIIVNEAKNK